MPGTNPKSDPQSRKKFSEEDFKNAIAEIKNGCSIRKASKDFGIPKTTLCRTIRSGKIKKFQRKTILTSKEENCVIEWVKECAQRGFGKTGDQIREAVKQVLDKAGRRVKTFTCNRPGKTWWYGFLRRHPNIHMIKPKQLELSRASACSEEVVVAWFDAFETFLSENSISSADQIYNCDESGFPLQANSTKKVCAEKIAKRTFQLSSSSKTSITTLHCISASGLAIPPAVYFPGKNLNAEYSIGFPKNYFIGFSDSGWMETYHFYAWVVNHFVKQISPKRPVVLVIDGHLSHVDYHTTLFCKENGILLFKLPPHTSHVMQPADRGYFNVLKNEWKKSCSRFMFENPGCVITKHSFSKVFVEAFDKSARPDVIKAAFKCSGIWPVDRDVIDSSTFAPSKVFKTTDLSTTTVNQDTNVPPYPNDAAKPTFTEAHLTSTPKKEEKHPVLKSLEQIEVNAGVSRVRIFEMRLEEGYDIEDDALYNAWKALKIGKQKIEKEIIESSDRQLNISMIESDDLRPIIQNVLTYPQASKNEKKTRKKVNIPRHMTSEAALKILEIKDAEKRQKQLIKEVKRQRAGKKLKGRATTDGNKMECIKIEKKTKNHQKLKIKENHKKIKVQAEKENDQLGSNSIRENGKEKKKLENRKKSASDIESPVVACRECGFSHEDGGWVQCDKCKFWYHIGCTNLIYVEHGDIEVIDWFCVTCE